MFFRLIFLFFSFTIINYSMYSPHVCTYVRLPDYMNVCIPFVPSATVIRRFLLYPANNIKLKCMSLMLCSVLCAWWWLCCAWLSCKLPRYSFRFDSMCFRYWVIEYILLSFLNGHLLPFAMLSIHYFVVVLPSIHNKYVLSEWSNWRIMKKFLYSAFLFLFFVFSFEWEWRVVGESIRDWTELKRK